MKDATHQADGWDYALLIGGILGVFLGLTGALALAVVALTGWLRGNPEAALTGEWSVSATLIMALSCLPAIYYGGRSVLGRVVRTRGKPKRAWLYLTLLFPVSIGAGYLAYERGILTGLLGPVSHLFAAGLPVMAAVVIIRRLGPELPERRVWGQFLAGLWVTPACALTLELIALVPLAAALVIGIRSSIDFKTLSELMVGPDPLNTPEYTSLVRGLILQPWVIILVLSYVALIVPIIEETLKSVAVWPFLRMGLSPAEAFSSGTLAGGGYALFEALFLTQPGAGWVETMLARVGATFVHVLTAGLSSWGLVQGFRYRAWAKGILAALLAIIIHGLWNAGAVGIGVSVVADEAGIAELGSQLWQTIGAAGVVLLTVIGAVALVAPVMIAGRLTKAESEAVSEAVSHPSAGPPVPS